MPLVAPIKRYADGSAAHPDHAFFIFEDAPKRPSQCKECGRGNVPHYANNMCVTCYMRLEKQKQRSKERAIKVNNQLLTDVVASDTI